MENNIKRLQCKVADIDGKKRLVKAYFSAFNNIDNDGEVVMAGALTKSINESGPNGKNRIKHYLNHDLYKVNAKGVPIGYNQEAVPLGMIIEMGVDSYGGYFVSKMARTLKGEDIYSMYLDGMIDEHSFSYEIIKSKTRQNKVKELYELRISEISTVTTVPANYGAHTIEVKQGEPGQPTQNKYEALFIEPSRVTLDEKAAMQTIFKLTKFNI